MGYKDPEKQRAYLKRHYEANKRRYHESSKRFKRSTVEEVRALKESKPCFDCGLWYPYYVMQFDHVRGEKKFAIAKIHNSVGRKRLEEELDKCDLVCANCHAVRTHFRLEGPA